MAIKVQFEIGHSATVKSKPTPEGFTHDWELYVQGVNKVDISAFVDKVVFNLHESFPKPKRSFKEPPYVLKESGYAGFVLAIDIFFRNRDEPKRVTYSYDLDLQQEGPPLHRSEVKKFIFEAPSEDFRQKLLKGGGIAVSGVVGGAITADEKSVDTSGADNRSQMVGKPKLSSDATSTSSSSSKKHKQRPDEKTNTFTNLFGTPINKTAPKYSPDPKTKTANGGAPIAPAVGKSGGGKDKGGSSVTQGNTTTGPAVGSGKEKEKSEKKDKHKQTSPNKEKNHEEKKKSDGKHEKRDEKKKDKKDKDKDRERNKEKASKRSVSPKSAAATASSPKRPAPSPVRSLSAASRDDPGASVKPPSKSAEGEKRTSGSSGGKKSKKEKKSHDKDREHKDKHRSEAKESIQATTTATTVTAVPPAVVAAPPATQPPAQASSKLQNPTVASKADLNSNKNPKTSDKESKKSEPSSKTADKDAVALPPSDKKSSTEKDKKSHKHKKKDKNKEKEKDKDKDKDQTSKKSTSSKEKKDKKEKTAKSEATTASNSTTNAAANSKKSTETPVDPAPTESVATKQSSSAPPPTKVNKQSNNASTVPTTTNSSNSNSNMGTSSASALLNSANDLSDVDSLNSEILHTVSNSNSEKGALIQNSDSSNSSFPELPPVAKQPTSLFQAPANPQPTPPPSTVPTPLSTPSSLSTPAAILEPPRPADKKDHKPHRGADKTKADKAAEKEDKKRRRNSTAVNTFVEPPLKQIKKDFNTTKSAREKSQSPLLRTEDKQTFLPPPATTSALPAPNTAVTALNLEYLSELQELHQKIMTLQDNEELQQVVEMIAATGRYEITSKTFDFDLCKLDRNTVQRLQDFFATSVS